MNHEWDSDGTTCTYVLLVQALGDRPRPTVVQVDKDRSVGTTMNTRYRIYLYR